MSNHNPVSTSEPGAEENVEILVGGLHREAANGDPTLIERLEVLEHSVADLRATTDALTDALGILAASLQSAPLEGPGDASLRKERGGREAHDLLIALRDPSRLT